MNEVPIYGNASGYEPNGMAGAAEWVAKFWPNKSVSDSSERLRDIGHSLDRCGVITEAELSEVRQIARKLQAWKNMATDLYGWEEIEAVSPFRVPYKGPRRGMPEGYTELSNSAGVSPREWKVFCEANG
jgi:hypothetical protein